MIGSMDYKKLSQFYENNLKETLLPFWLNNSIDKEYGGYFTCFDNLGENLLSHDKYTWSQGRMVWVFSKLAAMDKLCSEQEKKQFLNLAKSGADFLIKNCVLTNGNCTFIMERDGTPKKQSGEEICDTSFYADCFAILGLSRYGLTSGCEQSLAFCKKLYMSVLARVNANDLRTAPYPVPNGYKMHGIPMIMLNTSHEFSHFLKAANDDMYSLVYNIANNCMDEIMNNFADEDFIIHEMISRSGERNDNLLCERYINPGHTLEDMWFIIHYARENNLADITDKAIKIIKRTTEIGWDEQYGGLLLFADKEGGAPKGIVDGMESHAMINKIINDWSSKLWWPHSEALYATMLAYDITGASEFAELYQKVHDYTFKTFPNPKKEIGEWIQIRDRLGAPQEKTVALSVKDPFHIIRNFLLILELLQLE